VTPGSGTGVQRARSSRRLLLILVAAALVGIIIFRYAMSHFVLSYSLCDAPAPPVGAIDVVDEGGCWTYKLPWP
jgi:hypothetical protein